MQKIRLNLLHENDRKGRSGFIQTAKLAESEGKFCDSWERPGSNPGPWAPKRSVLPTALLAPV